ncbi:MAG: hypothetical protein IKR04_06695 [Clostridia bacterium]|nr:hypothetical protein [Clostridia bacterium]
MRLLNVKKIGLLTGASLAVSSIAFAAGEGVTRSLADWVSLVAEILSFVCLAVFIIYAGKLLKINKDQAPGGGDQQDATATRVSNGVKNGIMTTLVGIALCQAVIIVAQALFAK